MLIYKPYKFLIYGLIMYFALLLLGPYNYTLYGINGALYLALAFALFIVSAWLSDRPFGKKKLSKNKYKVIISKKAEVFIIIAILISYIAFVIHIIYLISSVGVNEYQFAGGDFRATLSDGRPLWDKLAEIMMSLGTAIYLIVARLRKTNYKYTTVMALIALFLPAIAILGVGARSRVVTTIGLFLIVYGLNKRESFTLIDFSAIRLFKYKWLMVVGIGVLFYFTLSLFSIRGAEDATSQYLRYYGDTTLKPIYLSLYEITNGGVGPVYKGLLYYTHSMPVFTWAFDQFKDVPMHWGALLFYLEGYILRIFNIPFPDYLPITSQWPAAGLYSTFLSGYFLDWGKIGTLFAIFITGLLFGRISFQSRKKRIAYYILPVILFMCWVAPIYYFWHMGWESVLLWFFIIYPICRLLGLKRVRCDSEA